MIAKFENASLPERRNYTIHKYKNLMNLPHWHVECELIFAEKGYADVTVNSETYHLTEGRCIFTASGTIHNINSDTDNVISIIKINHKIIEATFGGYLPVCPMIKTSIPFHSYINELLEAEKSSNPYRSVICDSILIRLLAELFGECQMHAPVSESGSTKYKELLSIIDERYTDITFEEAARFMCYSKPYFSKYFTKVSGISFSSYLNIIRMEKAIAMLNEGKMSITEIAHAAGFGTIRHFNRIFKEITGYSPTALPKNYVLIEYRKGAPSEGFDPTLSGPAIL